MGGKSSGNQTQTTSSEPWGPMQPYLTKALPRIESDVLNRPKEYFPGSTVVPFSNQTEGALNWTEQRAMAGSPLLRNAQGLNNAMLGGQFLPGMPQNGAMTATGAAGGQGALAAQAMGPPSPEGFGATSGNPWLDATVQRAQDSVRGGLDSQFATSGRYGSGAHQGALANTYGNIATDIYGGAYESERGRQMQAMGMAPGLAMADYSDIGMLANVGAQREDMAQREMQDTVNRFNFQQDEPANRLRDYLALLQGGFGGTGTQTKMATGGQQGSGFGNTLLGLGRLGLDAYGMGLFGPAGRVPLP